MKVYGGCLDGRNRVIVAAKSLKEAAKLFGISYHSARLYVSETSNEHEITVAMIEPRKVFSKSLNERWK